MIKKNTLLCNLLHYLVFQKGENIMLTVKEVMKWHIGKAKKEEIIQMMKERNRLLKYKKHIDRLVRFLEKIDEIKMEINLS